MSAAAPQATPPNDPGPPSADPRGHGQALDELIRMGTAIARVLHAQALAQAAHQPTPSPKQPAPGQHAASTPQPMDAPSTPPPTPDLPAANALIRTAAAFNQIARCVRRCVALAQTLDHPKQPARIPAQHRTAARKRILRAVEDAIQRPPDAPDLDDPDTLHAELLDRMDAPDLDDDIASRPVEDIIRDILRDLGIAALMGTRPWKRRTPAHIAELCTRAAAPSRASQSSPGPQDNHPGPIRQAPDPQSDQRGPASQAGPPAVSPAQPGPTEAGSVHRPPVHPSQILPEDPAEAVAFILNHHARGRPPPGS
ncbi:MAG TPA: hypothetical protein VGC15_13330 [Acetobacteraceae bacterium]